MANAPARFTPAPWHLADCRHQKNGQIRIFGSLGGHIGNVLASNSFCQPDANLIAAAPELLAACKAIVVRLPPAFADNIAQLNAAIQKAEARNG